MCSAWSRLPLLRWETTSLRACVIDCSFNIYWPLVRGFIPSESFGKCALVYVLNNCTAPVLAQSVVWRLAPNGLVGNRSWLIAKDLPIPVENRPSHRQFSGEVAPGAYSNACPVRGRPPCRAIANARVLIPRAQSGSGGTRADQDADQGSAPPTLPHPSGDITGRAAARSC